MVKYNYRKVFIRTSRQTYTTKWSVINIYSTLFIIEMIEKTILKKKTKKQAEASTSKHTAMRKLPAIHIYKTN